jgi:UDP-N-acetylmuramate--alanine ligase
LNAARKWNGRRLHFIGIGGAGMSGLALVCARLGAEVSGSDRADSSYMERLRSAGLAPVVGHDAKNLPEGAEVIVSTAIADDNPELERARERGVEPIHRGALLAELCAEKRLIAIAGTHGKTTTTAMAVWALRALGADPAFFVGGEVPGLGTDGSDANAGWGEGEWAVAEADESDASFLELKPEVAVVTNVEMDHHSRWGSLAELHGAFRRFAEAADWAVLPAGGSLDQLARSDAGVIHFDEGQPGLADLRLAVPGAHNRRNARAALGAISGFLGVRRRLQSKGSRGGLRIYDDYAHHPTEVRAALSALREYEPERLIVVFQPHLYSRTKALAEQFGAALTLADEIFVLDVYPAREEPIGELAGVSGLQVAEAAADHGGGKRVWWLPRLESAQRVLAGRFEPDPVTPGVTTIKVRFTGGTILVTLGAGDVYKLGEALAEGAA